MKKPTARLRLRAETLRPLDRAALVAGGATIAYHTLVGCAPQSATCNVGTTCLPPLSEQPGTCGGR